MCGRRMGFRLSRLNETSVANAGGHCDGLRPPPPEDPLLPLGAAALLPVPRMAGARRRASSCRISEIRAGLRQLVDVPVVKRQRMSGKTLKGRWKNPPTMEERVSHYLTRVSVSPDRGCWIWDGKKRPTDGYACVTIDYRSHLLHRVVYEHLVRPLSSTETLHHKCEVTSCINPQHLEPCSHAEHRERHGGFRQIAAASAKARSERTHCAKGHEYTPENTILRPGSWRKCRICDNARRRERYAEWRASKG